MVVGTIWGDQTSALFEYTEPPTRYKFLPLEKFELSVESEVVTTVSFESSWDTHNENLM